ncbi:MAG: hypothetical protein DMG68_15890 [Acidobacteria bacterium]|nr:MAG: hypothetical protein DMG68_15890 [Acidobacteriota bacterium]
MDCKLGGFRVAVTDTVEFTATVQVSVVPEQAPLHPAKPTPGPGATVSVTDVPLGKVALHVVPQLIPPGVLLTVPFPPPAKVTLSWSGTGCVAGPA